MSDLQPSDDDKRIDADCDCQTFNLSVVQRWISMGKQSMPDVDKDEAVEGARSFWSSQHPIVQVALVAGLSVGVPALVYVTSQLVLYLVVAFCIIYFLFVVDLEIKNRN